MGVVADLWALPQPREEPPLRQVSWIFRSFRVLVCESVSLHSGSWVCGFEQKVLSEEGFPARRSQPTLLTPPFSFYCCCDSWWHRERAARRAF